MKEKMITKEELKKMISKRKEFILIDVLDEDKHAESHIVGSINIPLEKDFEKKLKKTVPDKKDQVIFYSSDGKEKIKEAVRIAMKIGYKNVLFYPGSIKEWRNAGGEVHAHLITERG